MDSALPRMLLGVFGDELHPPRRADWLVHHLQMFASKNGIEFTWHGVEQSTSASQWLDEVARTLGKLQSLPESCLLPAA
jgi:hypothetical protein